MAIDNILAQMYKTPHRVATVVFFTVHAALIGTQAGINNNHLKSKYKQFLEHPALTTLEIAVPYIVTYIVNLGGRYNNKKK